MIPKKLRLKNFLSYGNDLQELDFDSFQLAVLTGENGAGKSSLLEAIPFCIWGKGREEHAHLIRKGAREARIELEFEVQNNIYRITRILKNTKSTTSQELEFAIYDNLTHDFRSLTRESITDTKEEIQKRIGITRETFINSAFFAQGKADAFTTNKPTERRKILSEILGLNRYEELSKKAKELAKHLEGKIESNLTRIELLKLDIASLPALRSDYEQKRAEERHAEAELASIKASLDKIDSDLHAFQQQEKNLAVLNAELASLTKQLEQEQKQIQLKQAELSNIELHLQKRDELLDKQRELDAIKAEVQSLEQLQSRTQSLKEEIARQESEYKAALAKHQAEKKSAQEQLFKLNQMIAERQKRIARKTTLLQEYRDVQMKIDALKKDCAQLPEHESRRDAIKTELSNSKAAIDTAQAQMNAISEKGKKLREISDTCPLCQSPIDNSHREHILQTYRREYVSHREQKMHHEALLQKLQQVLSQVEKEIASLKQKERDLQLRQNDLNKLTTEMASLEEIERELKQLESDKIVQEAKEQDAELALQSLANTTSRLNALRAELAEIGYDPLLHEQKKRTLKTLEFVPAELAKLESEAKRREVLVQEISEHRKHIESLLQTRAAKETECNTLRQALQAKATLEGQKQDALKEKQNCEARLTSLIGDRKALEKSIAEKEEKKKTLLKLQDEIVPEQERLDLYKILAEAYGVKGIQALLLEKAIPEIERSANELLAQLTNNLFSLSFQTEQEKKDGDIKQVLDIIISDANGNTRPYETFSGGERFRIDFSLRLALSKYLATVSGTPIKMLVIDEGFGTQDQNGIDAMIEAINQVSDDFEKLILITHLEEMKDAFPTRIVVKRDPLKGSHFEVIF